MNIHEKKLIYIRCYTLSIWVLILLPTYDFPIWFLEEKNEKFWSFKSKRWIDRLATRHWRTCKKFPFLSLYQGGFKQRQLRKQIMTMKPGIFKDWGLNNQHFSKYVSLVLVLQVEISEPTETKKKGIFNEQFMIICTCIMV